MNFKVEGQIVSVGDIKTLNNGAKTISFQVQTNEQYNSLYSFDIYKGAEHASHVDNFSNYQTVGDNVRVEFNVRTNEWQGKFYTSLSCWKVEKLGQMEESETIVDEADDDLPF